jgi:hypothetical protein
LHLPTNQPPPWPTQIPAQPIANPNNKLVQPAYNAALQTFPTYLIASIELQEIHLRSRKALNKKSLVIIEENEEEENPIQNNNNDSIIKQLSPKNEQAQSSKLPPYPKRLNLEKPNISSEFDFLS